MLYFLFRFLKFLLPSFCLSYAMALGDVKRMLLEAVISSLFLYPHSAFLFLFCKFLFSLLHHMLLCFSSHKHLALVTIEDGNDIQNVTSALSEMTTSLHYTYSFPSSRIPYITTPVLQFASIYSV